jgi:hypothetical protein
MHLVGKIGQVKTKPIPLYFKMLRWLLLINFDHFPTPDSLAVVYIKSGRVAKKPDDQHSLLDKLIFSTAASDEKISKIPLQLSCVVAAALTKLAVSFPQYRPQTVHLFERVAIQLAPTSVLVERIAESLILLKSSSFHHLNRDLQTGPSGG